MLAESGQPERALAMVRDALPREQEFNPSLVRLLLRLDPTGATDALFKMHASEEWDSETFGMLRALLIESGQEGRLKPFLERALDTRPTDHGLLRQLRRVDAAAARDRIGEFLRNHPEDPWAWVFLGEIQRDAGDAAAAFEAFRKAAERDPDPSTWRELSKVDPARALDLVVAWAKDKTNDEAIGTLAQAYERAGRKDDAIRAYLRAYESDPDDSEWLDKIMELDPAAAVSAMERRIGPNREAATDRVLGRYGASLEAAGRTEEAFQQYLAALRKHPTDYRWQEALARVDPAAAIAPLEATIRTHPGDASAHGALGIALSAGGRRADAVTHLERALARGDAEHWYGVLKEIDPDRALEGLRRRADAERRDDDLWSLLGAELRERGLTAEAREAYGRAADLDPADRDVARALNELR
jgi:tetratricopeptide (TPR) repeat protein